MIMFLLVKIGIIRLGFLKKKQIYLFPKLD
jgi:hypothetical protein